MKRRFLLLSLFFGLVLQLAFTQDFEVYVSDAGMFNNPPWQILKFDENGENPEVYIDNNLAWPQDILFLEDQDIVLISNLNSGRITRHDISTGEYVSNFATGISGPTRIKIGPDGLLYVLQWQGNGLVKRYELDGSFVDDFTNIGVPQSIGLDWDDDGNLYVSSYTGDAVWKFDPDGNFLEIFAESGLLGPTNIWFDAAGDLLVSDYDGTAIKRFDAMGNSKGDFITGLRFSEGVDFFPDGRILIGNGGSRSVKMYDADGNYIREFVPSGSGNLLVPNAVVIRDIRTTATEDVPIESVSLANPTIGSVFHMDAEMWSSVLSFEVYTVAGQLIESTKPGSNQWSATDQPQGLYILRFALNDGTMHHQKICVKH